MESCRRGSEDGWEEHLDENSLVCWMEALSEALISPLNLDLF